MFKRYAIVVMVLSLLATSAFADNWNFDKAHSSIGFSVRHMVISKTRGTFSDYTGQVVFDGKNMDKASVDVTVQIASVDTDNEDRDAHLLKDDFFDVEKYPTMTFKSTKIVPGEGNTFTMVGNLTIKDVTREVSFSGEFFGAVDDPWGNTKAGFSASTTINRRDFHVTFDSALQDGSLVVGNDVNIQLEIELVKAK